MKNRHKLKLKNRMTRILKVAVIGGIAFPLFFAAAAQAHDTLVQTTPKDGDTLRSAPPSVQLRFSNTPLAQGTVIEVVDNQQKNWAAGAPEITPNTVTQRLQSGIPAGEYEVRGNIVSSDGHVVNPSYKFNIGGAGERGAVPLTPNADSTAQQSTSATQTTEASSSPSSSDSSTPPVVEDIKKTADSFPWWIVWTSLIILLALLVAWWIWKKMKSGKNTPQQKNTVENKANDDTQGWNRQP